MGIDRLGYYGQAPLPRQVKPRLSKHDGQWWCYWPGLGYVGEKGSTPLAAYSRFVMTQQSNALRLGVIG